MRFSVGIVDINNSYLVQTGTNLITGVSAYWYLALFGILIINTEGFTEQLQFIEIMRQKTGTMACNLKKRTKFCFFQTNTSLKVFAQEGFCIFWNNGELLLSPCADFLLSLFTANGQIPFHGISINISKKNSLLCERLFFYCFLVGIGVSFALVLFLLSDYTISNRTRRVWKKKALITVTPND